MSGKDLSPEQRLNRISEHGLCIGCGLCQSVAGPDRVRMAVTPEGYERPVIHGALDHETVDRIYDVCPSTRVEGLPEALVGADTTIDPVWGPYLRIVLSHAADPDVRHKASTGGVLSALAAYLLDSGRVEFILHVAAGANPMGGERHVSIDRAGVMQAAGSRYGPAAPLLDIGNVLDRGRSFAFIGKPCDIAALRNLARHDPRVDELCRYMLTLVCGGYMEAKAMRRFLAGEGIKEQDVTSFRYRGHGCPGLTRIETKDGRVIEKNYLDMWGEDDTAWGLPFRCKVCPDGIGEAADIAASDTWPGGAPTWEGQEEDKGTNAVLARSAAGLELLEAAVRDGALVDGGEIGPRVMDDYQPHQVKKKLSVWSRYAGLKAAGRLVPEVARLRIADLARQRSFADNLAQARGTRQRVHEGRTSEETPRDRADEE